MSEFKRTIIVSALFFLLALIVFSPFVFGGKIFLDSDTTSYSYPIFDFYSQSIKNNESFTWNSFIYSGFPSYVSQTGGFFDPLNYLLFKFLPTIQAYHLRLFIGLFLVLFFSYLAGRSFVLSFWASTMIGIGYLSAFNWVYLSNMFVSNTLFLLPFLMLVSKKILLRDHKKWLWAMGGGVGIGWAMLGGNAQIVVYTVFSVFVSIILRHLFYGSPVKNLRSLTGTILLIAVMVLVGLVVALPQIIPTIRFVPLTTRAGGIDYALSTFKSLSPGNMFNFLFPDHLYFPYVSDGRKPLHIGAFLFFLAVIGFSFARQKKQLAVWSAVFGFCFLASLKFSPIFYMMQQLPVFSYFRNPYKWMFVGAFFLSLIGALGFDLIQEKINEVRVRWIVRILGIVVVGTTIFILALNFLPPVFWERISRLAYYIFSHTVYGRFGFYKEPLHYREAVVRGLIAWREFTSLADVYFLIPFLAMAAGWGLIAVFLKQWVGRQTFRIAGLVLALVAFLGSVLGQFSNNISRNLVLGTHKTLINKFISSRDLGTYRTFPFMLDYGFVERIPPKFKYSLEERQAYTELRFASGWPNTNLFANVSSVEGYDPLMPRNQLEVMEILGSVVSAGDETAFLTVAEKTDRLTQNTDLLGMMAGKYIISGIKLSSSSLKFIGETEISRFNIPVYVYENPQALPRFYLAKTIVNAPGKSLPELIMAGYKNFEEKTYLDCVGCDYNLKHDKKDGVDLLVQKNGVFEFKGNTFEPRWLVLSESNLPGWKVTIDGQSQKIERANGIYMAVRLPAGEHKIKFSFGGI